VQPLPCRAVHNARSGARTERGSIDFKRRTLAAERWKVIPSARVVFCGIEKNGITELEAVCAISRSSTTPATRGSKHRIPLGWGSCSMPEATNVTALLANRSWRFAVVVRDPVERFLSAYRSKCMHADGPESWGHCNGFLGFASPTDVNVSSVASSLVRVSGRGRSNPHWLSQSAFCGGLNVHERWRQFSHVIRMENFATGVLDALHGRVADDTLAAVEQYLSHHSTKSASLSRQQRHATHAAEHVTSLSVAQRRLVGQLYVEDYRLFETMGLPYIRAA
jgi:hypothetical protein